MSNASHGAEWCRDVTALIRPAAVVAMQANETPGVTKRSAGLSTELTMWATPAASMGSRLSSRHVTPAA